MTPSRQTSSDARKGFLSCVAAGDTWRAIQAARTLLKEDPSIRQLSFIRHAVEKIPPEKLSLTHFRVALLSSFSIEFIHNPLVVYGLLDGLRIEIYQAGFGQFRQEILNPQSGLYGFAPDVVILAVEGKDWVPSAYHQYLTKRESGFDATISELRNNVADLVRIFRDRSNATLLIHNFAPPIRPQLGILDGHVGIGQAEVVQTLNAALFTAARVSPGVYVVGYAGLITRHGSLHWYDERMEYYARAPVAQEMLGHLAAEYMKFFRALTGRTKKCLVVDLDNTLWGGVLGEEGIHGIALGPNYPGSAYVAFQEEILNLHKRGVVLAIASKNNPADVDEVFEQHRHMVLKKEHFAQVQIHWKPKRESLVAIADELGLGLEHMVFVDDDPVECQQVVDALPMLTVKLLPKHPEHFVRALLDDGLFDALSFSSEDRRRGELYRQRTEAKAFREKYASLEDFYHDLAMQVSFVPGQMASLARAVQLTQKTNQFNVTTIRYSESELTARMADPDWLIATVSVRDRFGDHGIVGLMMGQVSGGEMAIDTFLLSCRVIGRTIETAMLAYLCDEAVRRGVSSLRGRLVPTAKNVPARDLFEQHAFRKIAELESGETSWVLDVNNSAICWPKWIQVVEETHAQ